MRTTVVAGLVAIASTGCASSRYLTDDRFLCIHINEAVVTYEIETASQTLISGKGIGSEAQNGFRFSFLDSFGNSGTGLLQRDGRVTFELRQRGKNVPFLVAAAYKAYAVHESGQCGSEAL